MTKLKEFCKGTIAAIFLVFFGVIAVYWFGKSPTSTIIQFAYGFISVAMIYFWENVPVHGNDDEAVLFYAVKPLSFLGVPVQLAFVKAAILFPLIDVFYSSTHRLTFPN